MNSKKNLNSNQLNKYKQYRIICLVAFIFYPLLFIGLQHYTEIHPLLSATLNAIVGLYLVINWLYLDAAIINYKENLGLIAAGIFLIAIVTVPYYLIKSRGKEQGLRAIGYAAAIFLGHIIISGILAKIISPTITP